MKREQQKLIQKAKESLLASQVLSERKLYNFAGSRAYYTMFYIAEAFLWEKGYCRDAKFRVSTAL